MKLTTPDYYAQFKCIDTACTDSCCAGWEVDVDEESYAYYETVGGEFGKRLASVMSRDGGCHFILTPQKDCPFLNKSGLCDLYTQLGEDKLCETCAMYPRFVEDYGSTREMGIALSCKTAAKLILTYGGRAGFVTSEDGKPLTSYNDIAPELYFMLHAARNTAYDIAQNGAYDIRERAALLLSFAVRLQHCINSHRYSVIDGINKMYSSQTEDVRSEILDGILKKLRRKYTDWSKAKQKDLPNAVKSRRNMLCLLRVFEKLETVKAEFPDFIKKDGEMFADAADGTDICKYRNAYLGFFDGYGACQKEFEHIMVYYIFRYFLKAVYDYDLLGKVKIGITGLIMVLEMDIVKFAGKAKDFTLCEQIETVHLYSREIEHSYENFAELEKMYNSSEVFSEDNLYRALLFSLH